MRPELLEDRVLYPQGFARNVENLAVCHCDQVPMWLRLGATKQLFTGTEVTKCKKRKLHEAKNTGEVGMGGTEQGGQVQ